MKDKLVKNGRHKPYYRFVGALKGLGFSLLALIVLASPVVIAMEVSANEAHAEETSRVQEEEPSASSSEN